MFDFEPSSKRTRLAFRFFTYGVMTVSVVVISTVMVFLALGYRFDRNFNFTQGGLVQFRSLPGQAEVTVDGVKTGLHTPDKLNVFAGKHTVTMMLGGYRAWSKDFELAPGQLLWLNYVRLFPETISTSNIREFSKLSGAKVSHDRRWLILQVTYDSPDFTLVDLGDEKTPKFTDIRLPDTQLDKKDNSYGTFSVVEWDAKSESILVKQQLGDKSEFIRVDRSKPSEAINITRLFGLSTTEVHFSTSNANILFANTGGILRRLDVGSKSASGALVYNLKRFVVGNDNAIAFTAEQEQAGNPATKQQVLATWRNEKVITVRSFEPSDPLVFAYSEYDNHEHLAFADKTDTVTVLRDPSAISNKEQTAVFAELKANTVPDQLSFSPNGRMLLAQNKNKLATYDLEESKTYAWMLDGDEQKAGDVRWLDDFYLWVSGNGTLRVQEFDGANERDITSVEPRLDIALSTTGKRLFSLTHSAATNTFYLQVSRLSVAE